MTGLSAAGRREVARTFIRVTCECIEAGHALNGALQLAEDEARVFAAILFIRESGVYEK